MYDDDDRVNTQLTMMGYLVTVLHTTHTDFHCYTYNIY